MAEPFCINAKLLGTEKHLLCSDDWYSWHDEAPKHVWHLSGAFKRCDDWCLDSLLKLGDVAVNVRPPQKFVNAFSTVSVNSSKSSVADVPWRWVMSARDHKSWTCDIVQSVRSALPNLPVEYFDSTWRVGNAVIRSLRRARVDRFRIERLVNDGVGNAHIVKTFAPDVTGYAKKPVYERLNTLTGRLTVSSGSNILTLKREYRDLIVPSKPGGGIVFIDFAALEARVLLYEAGRRCDDVDLYSALARELGYDRRAVKGAVISELYGSSRHALGITLGIDGRELDEFVARVRSYFDTRALLNRIKQQFYRNGYIVNRYGRRVNVDEPIDRIFMSYYGQSTGVDVTMHGFNRVIKQLSKEAPNARPLFLLHDALVLDVPADELETVLNVKSVVVPGYVQPFALKSELQRSVSASADGVQMSLQRGSE